MARRAFRNHTSDSRDATQLLERDAALIELDHALEAARSGVGELVLLHGEAGIGKTSLTTAFCVAAEGSLASVSWGACDPLSTPQPMGPLLDIASEAGGRLQRRLTDTASAYDIYRAFLTWLGGGRQPTIAVFEDIHWTDQATLDLLRFVGRRIAQTNAVLIATYRDDLGGEDHPLQLLLGDLASGDAIRRIHLSPLSMDAVGELAAGTGFDPSELHRQTAGNPFYVAEMLQTAPGEVPATIHDAVQARARRLSLDAREVLATSAVVGPAVDLDMLRDLTTASDENIQQCVDAGLLRFTTSGLSFRHEIAREAIYQSLSPLRCRKLHRDVLQYLETRTAGVDDRSRLAHHAEAVGDCEAVLRHAPVAARQASDLHANRESARQFERAIPCADQLPINARIRLLCDYGQVLYRLDRLERSLDVYGQALQLAINDGDRLKEAEISTYMLGPLMNSGRNEDAERASKLAIDILESLPPGPDLARAYHGQANIRMLNRDGRESISWAARAMALAEQFDVTDINILALNTLGSAHLTLNKIEEGQEYLDRSLRLAERHGLDQYASSALVNLGSGLGEYHMFRAASGYLTRSIRFSLDRGFDFSAAYARSWRSLVQLALGRWEEARQDAQQVLEGRHVAVISQITALVALGRLDTRRGVLDERGYLDRALDLASGTDTLQRLAPVRATQAEAAWLAGDLATTRHEAGAVYDMAVEHEHPWFVGELSYWLWKAGEIDHVPAIAAEPYGLQIRGEWRAAADAWSALDCPYETGRALAESKDVYALRQALDIFHRLEARPMAAFATAQLRELGAEAIPRGPRPATRANPANLTSRQLEVLRFVAAGMTNQEIAQHLFISPKTVEHHVSAILKRLNVATRTEAAGWAANLDIDNTT